MTQERNALPASQTHTRKDAELFIYLRLETAGAAPLLASEDVAQAARTALASRVRQHRCRVLAQGSGAGHLHVVLQFPASLSLRDLVQVAREASGLAVAQALSAEGGVSPPVVWGGPYQLDTLSQADVAGAAAYVGRPLDLPAQHPPARAEAGGEIGPRPAWPRWARERPARYHHAPEAPLP